jgi:CheY-like chemotaxis protein
MGTVKWVRDTDEGRGVGVEFDALPDEASQRLDEIVSRIASGDPDLVARTLRVLVVEDNPHVATLIRDGLAGGSRRELAGRVHFGFETATNGREALDLLRSQPFDAMIIDIYLPVMDGAQVIAAVRADETLRSLPIVAVSAGGVPAKTAALSAGADFFLDKPMRLADILESMRKLTGLT